MASTQRLGSATLLLVQRVFVLAIFTLAWMYLCDDFIIPVVAMVDPTHTVMPVALAANIPSMGYVFAAVLLIGCFIGWYNTMVVQVDYYPGMREF